MKLPRLETSRLVLQPVEVADYPSLFEWRNTPRYMDLFSGDREVVSFDEFIVYQKRQDQRADYGQFAVVRRRIDKIIGLAYFFNLHRSDGYVFMNVFLEETHKAIGLGPEAGIAVLCFLFDSLVVHRVYFDVFEHNTTSRSVLETAGFSQEARLKEHHLRGGKRCDVLRYAAYRNDAERLRKIILPKRPPVRL